jgi:signal transduction histidine kinase
MERGVGQLLARGLVLDLSLPGGPDRGEEPVVAWADEEKLRQVLLNLLSNAAKFTPARPEAGTPGMVRVGLTAGAKILLRVHDTGIGIPPEKLGAIFDPFVQVQDGLTRAYDGTGLGLSIGRELARGMGGDIAVESTSGAGSTF